MKKILSLGVDGGGFDLFILPNNAVVEKGSSGGILDEEEDPIRSWNYKFESFELWFDDFTKKHDDFWICFSLMFIDDTVKDFMMQKVLEYKTENNHDYYIKEWIKNLNRKTWN